ncbi:MAG: septum formation initiator family protein [Lachnospiraceae bacterium]|nr:septum formation initiator family protein [Lachnospiraceae bacterium]
MKKKKKKLHASNRRGMRIIALAVLVLFAVFSYKTMGLKQQVKANKKTIEKYKQDLKKLKEEKQEIENMKKYTDTDAYIEQQAREKFGLVYKDEVIFQADEEQ